MKKVFNIILIILSLIIITGCDKGYSSNLDVFCNNELVKIIVNDEELNYYNFNYSYFNQQIKANYSDINFNDIDNDYTYSTKNKFLVKSKINQTCNLSLNITRENKYVTDFLRVAIIIDNELLVFKYFEENEHIYNKEDDPDTLLYFNSKNEIFNNLSIDLVSNETKEIVVVIWIEESELYNSKGEHYKGWADKSYDATPIMLKLEIE